MAQTLVVITAGIDLSVGMIFTLTNCVASAIVIGEPWQVALGVVGTLLVGLLCGAINGAIVIYGRLQPIVATIATGAVYFGIALALRPFPGGSVDETLADFFTGRAIGIPGFVNGAGALEIIPTSMITLLVIVLVIWVPFSRSVTGRAAYAVGSSEVAAYMSGVPIRRAKFAAYALSGLLAGIGGLYVTFFTYTGEAAYASGNAYTLFSIAAVVLGGVSLFGGSGSAIGAIFGALAFRTIGDLLFVFDFDPLWQPLFQGVVLMLAVSLGAFALFRVKNRLEWFG
jgi:ribose transport system permease protein